jgi:pimeloyl-ACP methyl ester carboxylesterase
MLGTLNNAAVEYEQAGTGPDLLLLHSLLTEMSVFDAVWPQLTREFRVTRVNLPGYGRSMPRALHSVADYAGHVAQVMDALHLPRTTCVFGNGFGAFVAVMLALHHGPRFGKLIVADVVASFPEPARAPFRVMSQKATESGMNAILDAAIGRMFPPEFSAAQPDEVARRKAALAQADAASFSRACLALAALDVTAECHTISNPTLVLCGALDLTTPPALARALADGIPGARYAEIAGSGHCPMVEQPQAVVEHLLALV